MMNFSKLNTLLNSVNILENVHKERCVVVCPYDCLFDYSVLLFKNNKIINMRNQTLLLLLIEYHFRAF